MVEREPENVRIFKDAEGRVIFEGAGNFGKKLDLDQAVALLGAALAAGVNRVELPIIKVSPQVTVEDAELQRIGIKELISVGESDFSGSTAARIKNIEVGASKFSGYVIPQAQIASFNTQLGDVTGAEGYVPELVIQGPKLTKELGGGLCQVSSTAFRAALLAGLPIVERYAHSFAVHYYEPWGTDATIYPGHKDLRFENDTAGAILVQTTMNKANKTLRFHFYGTKDERVVKVIGPVSREAMIESKGFSTRWYRLVQSADQQAQTAAESPKQLVYNFLSRYQPSTKWAVQKPAPAPATAPEIVPTDAPPSAEAASAAGAPKAPDSGSSI
jgi:vancomycin resistance protein YoaR